MAQKKQWISTRATSELRSLVLSVAPHYANANPGMPNPSASSIVECLLREGRDSLRAKGVTISEVPEELTADGVDFTRAIARMLGEIPTPGAGTVAPEKTT